jgi:sialate O-acetylesterase
MMIPFSAFFRCGIMLFLGWGVAGGSAMADVTLPALISDHAVLQRSSKTAVWGTASPGEKVSVKLDAVNGTATAGTDGKWKIVLDLSKAGPGPFDLVVSGANKITLSDVLVGEVWLASGQSNMEFPVKYANEAGKTIAASANPQLHEFQVDNKTSPVPLDTCTGKWVVAGPDTTANFPAVGYFFCKKLQQDLGVPVGLISSRWGGTPVEAWTSLDALNTVPDLQKGAEASKQLFEEFPARVQAYAQAVQAWETQYGRSLPDPADPSVYAGPKVSTADWKPVHLPGSLTAAGLPDAGAIWIRRTMTLPPDVVLGHGSLRLGAIPGFDTVYWNGVKIAETKPETGGTSAGRIYDPPRNVSLQGEGVLAIRMAFPAGGAAIPGPGRWGTLALDGDWLGKAEKELPPVDADAQAAYPKLMMKAPPQQGTAAYLFNGMIAPLTPYTIKGAIWYQGESNANRASQYGTAFPLMIQDWRNHWGEGDFPFYFCQLANFMPRKSTPSDSAWAELRDAQTKALSTPNTGMAILIDCGEEGNLHPHDKLTPGERLAAIALANTYGKSVPFAGPTYASMAVEGDSIRLTFTHMDGGLVAKPLPAEYAPTLEKPDVKVPLVRNTPNSELEGFAICGDDHVWKWADAKIDKGTVVVRADGVTKPVAVRYAWADDPICNLYNGAGFPAGPFRTDDFPEITRDAKF